jgi:hypothetical protein
MEKFLPEKNAKGHKAVQLSELYLLSPTKKWKNHVNKISARENFPKFRDS